MFFLLLKIFFLLLLAALCGAALAWWWLRRNVDDVTDEYTRLTGEWQLWRQNFEAKLAGRPDADSGALDERLAAIEGAIANIQMPRTDLSPVLAALAGIRPSPAPAIDLEPIQSQLHAIEDVLAAIRIPELPSASDMFAPEPVDLSGITAQLHALTTDVRDLAATPAPDLGSVHDALRDLDARIQAIPTPLPPEPAEPIDLAPLADRLAAIERAVEAIDVPAPQTVDLVPVHERLAAVEAQLAALQFPAPVDLGGVQGRLDALDSRLAGLQMPEPTPAVDLGPVLLRLAALHEALAKPAQSSTAPPPPAPPAAPPPAAPPSAASPPAAASPAAASVVRSGSRNLLHHAAYGDPDDLKRIKGVAKVLEKMLHDVGIYYFWQIADWDANDIEHVDEQLTAFRGRIQRDGWVAQARAFSGEDGAAQKPNEV